MDEIKRARPKWMDDAEGNKVKKSKKHELRLAKEFNGRREPRSGANKFSAFDTKTVGRDITTKEYLIEHKFTEKNSMSVKKEWLDKITVSAENAMKTPMLIITFQVGSTSEDWVVIRSKDFKILENK